MVDADALLLAGAGTCASDETRSSTVFPTVIARRITSLVVAPGVPLSNPNRRLVATWSKETFRKSQKKRSDIWGKILTFFKDEFSLRSSGIADVAESITVSFQISEAGAFRLDRAGARLKTRDVSDFYFRTDQM